MGQDSLPGFEEVERKPVKSYSCSRHCYGWQRTVTWDAEAQVFICSRCGTIDKKRTKEWQDACKTK